jgi:hypothetical protein
VGNRKEAMVWWLCMRLWKHTWHVHWAFPRGMLHCLDQAASQQTTRHQCMPTHKPHEHNLICNVSTNRSNLTKQRCKGNLPCVSRPQVRD